ncbi:hypothetical protein ABQF34_08850 [Mycolicibacterium boenickei]
MAVRPLVTTGAALLSAGALVAGTPALFVPHDEITVAASDAQSIESKKSVTVDRLNLLALSDIDLQLVSDIFFRVDSWGGHVGGTYDPYYGGSTYGLHELYVQVDTDEDGNPVYARALNADGNALNAYLDEDGNPNVGNTAVYVKDADGNLERVNGEGDEPEYGTAPISGDIYRDGLVGLAYYLGDQVLDEVIKAGVPLISDAASFAYNNVTSYFYEAGLEETFRVVVSELTGGVNGPVGQALAVAEDLAHNWLTYTGAVATLVASGVPLAGPDLAAATSIFFFGGPVVEDGKEYNQGIDGVINYVVDRVLGAPVPTEPEDPDEEQAGAAAKSGTAVLASAREALPAPDKLVNVDLGIEAPATPEATPELQEPETATPEATPAEASAPVSTEKTTPKFNLVKDNPLSDLAEKLPVGKPTGKGGGAFAKGETNGQKFVEKATKSLENAFKPKTKAGADAKAQDKGKETAKADAGSTDSGSDSGSDK